MNSFRELSRDFSKFRSTLPYDHKETTRYFWVVPHQCLEPFSKELDEYSDLLPEEVILTYKNMFGLGSNMLGSKICSTDNPSNTIELYELSEYNRSFFIDNILNYKIVDINNDTDSVSLPNGLVVKIPTVIKYDSVKFTSGFDGIDQFILDYGLIYGEGFKFKLRSSNRLGNESVFGIIHYNAGIIELSRNNISNDQKFIRYYDLLVGYNSSHSYIGNITPYDYLVLSGNLVILGGPDNLVYSYDLDS